MAGGDMQPSKSTNSDQGMPSKPKIVIIMGATGTGKSRLAIDLASYFPIEIINADSMQVYRSLDILTNKVPPHEQNGVPHHLLGTISPDVEFTSNHFRDSAISFINEIVSRNRLPIIVGGTNYYIQALVSPFLFDDSNGELDEFSLTEAPDDDLEVGNDNFDYDGYDRLRDLDPVAANRIHPNDQRKINQYLRLYARCGVLPSKFFQQRTSENSGRVDDFRFDCCFIRVDATLPVVDEYVNHRVDCMIDGGLLDEVYDIYKQNADYTRGLRQAIGVREFEDFLRVCLSESQNDGIEDLNGSSCHQESQSQDERDTIRGILHSSVDGQQKNMLQEAIDKVKLNTRRLVRRQRRLNRLQTLFGWKIHKVDATESLSCHLEGNSDESWVANAIEPSVDIIKSFLSDDGSLKHDLEVKKPVDPQKVIQRDLWTQYTCEACGGRVLRGAYEIEQHKQGRGHRKRVSRLKKSRNWDSDTTVEKTSSSAIVGIRVPSIPCKLVPCITLFAFVPVRSLG